MKSLKNTLPFFLFGGIFLLLNLYYLRKEEFFFALLPLALIAIYVAVYHFEQLFLFIILFTPLSFNIEEFTGGSIGLYLPTEPLLFGMLLLIILNHLRQRIFDKNFLKHPITLIVFAQLLWILITAITSELPAVSFKFLLARLWFVVPIFFYGYYFFQNPKNIKRFIALFTAGMLIAATYTLIQHASYGFDEETGHWVMWPFFKDHTSYGAILALIFPPVLGLLFTQKNNPLIKLTLVFCVALFTVAIILSYTRAAWLSLVGALGIYLLIRFKIKFKYVAAIGVLGLIYIGVSLTQLEQRLEKVNAEHATEDFDERIESMANITTDASNLERLNRWSCAVQMWEERPVFGWGPGTYAMVYAPFQLSANLTIISTHSGNRGNAHSEYLGPLSEQGLPGLLLMLVLVASVFYYGIRSYLKMEKGEIKTLYLSLILGLSTYFMHGFLNNYLDTDKASVPIWATIALIVVIDLGQRKSKRDDSSRELSD